MNNQPKTPGAMVLFTSDPTPEMVGIFKEMLEAVDDGCSMSDKDILSELTCHIGAEQTAAVRGEPRTIKPFHQDPSEYVSLEDHRAYVAPLQARIAELEAQQDEQTGDGYVVVVRYQAGGERLLDRRRHDSAAGAGAVVNEANLSGKLLGFAYYREATAEDIAETRPV